MRMSAAVRSATVRIVSVTAMVSLGAGCGNGFDNVTMVDTAAVAAEGGGGGRPGRGGGPPGGSGGGCCDEIQYPTVVTFADRTGDSWTSDGGGAYSNSQHTRTWMSDFVDPTRADKFVFIANKERDHPILLDIPGVFTGPCNELTAGVHAPDATPDMYNTAVGWSGVSSKNKIDCGVSRTPPRMRVEIFDCTVVTHAAAGSWIVTADVCSATVSTIDRHGNISVIGQYDISYELVADETE